MSEVPSPWILGPVCTQVVLYPVLKGVYIDTWWGALGALAHPDFGTHEFMEYVAFTQSQMYLYIDALH